MLVSTASELFCSKRLAMWVRMGRFSFIVVLSALRRDRCTAKVRRLLQPCAEANQRSTEAGDEIGLHALAPLLHRIGAAQPCILASSLLQLLLQLLVRMGV